MHPYHIKEFTDERTASKLRSAERRALVAEARKSQPSNDPCADEVARGHGFRIPFVKWELRMQPTRTVSAER
ncbi:MAG: hypothetical protein ACRDHF_13485 [Tepidiformaceae bacterium]